jgi:hypothetical protein
MSAGCTDLFFDEVIIIKEPFGRGSNPPAPCDRVREKLISFIEDDFIGTEAREELILRRCPAAGRPHLMPPSQRFRMQLKLTNTE